MKHHAVEKAIRDFIISGDGIASDGRLPSERELAQRFAVSRTTVRRAIDSLCRQGWLISFQGRGTYIRKIDHTRCSQPIDAVTRCAQHYEEMGMQPTVTVLRQEIVPASETIAQYLRVPCGADVLYVEKLYQANRILLNESVSYLNLADFPGLERMNFSAPICEILRANYGAYPRKTVNTVEAVLPSEEIAKNLHITVQTPIMLFESLTTGILNGRYLPLEYFKTYHRTDYLRFQFEQEYEATDTCYSSQ